MCAYSGVYFVKLQTDQKTLTIMLNLAENNLKLDIFVNKVLEYTPTKFIAATWDNN